MNFQTIPPVEKSKDLLDGAFRKAREKGKQKNLKGNWLQIIRKKEGLKLDIIKDNIVPRLKKILEDFPGTAGLPLFYIKLMRLTIDLPKFKNSCGAVNWAVERISDLHKKYVREINKTKDRWKIKELSKQFYGRISSILKQIDKHLSYLEECRLIFRTYPDVKEMFTVCIYGFPNVGKTTLLNNLTSTAAKTAAYAFTTKTINAGYFTIEGKKIQVFDLPGSLARQEKKNKIELQAELVAKELADVIIYVFDLTENCGYDVQRQKQLFNNIKDKKKTFVYLSKQDILDKKVISEFKEKHYSAEEIKEKIGQFAEKKDL